MEDEKIKELFTSFHPLLSSSAEFMARVQKDMEMVETLRQYSVTLRRRNRLAVAIAAVCGFAFGVITMLLINPFTSLLSELTIQLPYLHMISISVDTGFIAWILIAGVSILAALHAYNLAIFRLTPKISLHK